MGGSEQSGQGATGGAAAGRRPVSPWRRRLIGLALLVAGVLAVGLSVAVLGASELALHDHIQNTADEERKKLLLRTFDDYRFGMALRYWVAVTGAVLSWVGAVVLAYSAWRGRRGG
ncbi:MAG: hypothetical protein KatS3mg102_0613 [Planctomycetota bacterium]|nr:MAG: hypothetical protein KatS3mg102_0613 [Planctomycetota bacterium]